MDETAFRIKAPLFSSLKLSEIAWVCVLYIVCARLGQYFAISPGNVTPVWIPSGIMLALALKLGSRIWPGVFLGAFLGNIWAYFSLETWPLFLSSLASASLNGIGDVISIVVAALIIKRISGSNRILENEKTLLSFLIFGAILGPLASAVFGAGGLYLFDHVAAADFAAVFMTWWIGDGVGVVIFAPFLLSWLRREKYFDKKTIIALCISVPYSLLLITVLFGLIKLPDYLAYIVFMFIPLLFVTLFRNGQRLVFTVQTAVLSLATVATSFGAGPFSGGTQLNSLLELQVFAGVFSLVLFFIALFNLEQTRNEASLEKRSKELEELYRKDALTGLWNRYRIKEFLELELSRFKRGKRPFGLLLVDIDDFKAINDRDGHLAGDIVLTEISSLISNHIRDIDFLGRWGGEEFILIVSDTSQNDLQTFAEKLNNLVAHHNFSVDSKITISIGIALVTESDSELTIIDRADAGLYSAKHAGKNLALMG
jgi:diguanylate cyclase (GGDEF)-like protein